MFLVEPKTFKYVKQNNKKTVFYFYYITSKTKFFDMFFEPRKADKQEPAKPRKARPHMKAEFLNWLVAKSGMDRVDLGRRLGKTLENLFLEIEEVYGHVSPNDLDPRYIQHFLVSS